MGVRWALVATLALGPGQPSIADPVELHARCAACHLADGSGVPGMFPPLAGLVDRFLASPDGRSYLARLVIGGTKDPVDILGVRYAGGMPAVVAGLSNAEVAVLLNDLAHRFGTTASDRPFSAQVVAAARKAGPLSPAERLSLRGRALAGQGVTKFPQPPGRPDRTVAARGEEPHRDWMLHCQGCHGADGGLATPGMAALKGHVAEYVRDRGGRARLVQVPGVANASLSDTRLARLLNWMLATFDAERLPEDFNEFTGEEVGALRGPPPANGSAHALSVANATAGRIVTSEHRRGSGEDNEPHN